MSAINVQEPIDIDNGSRDQDLSHIVKPGTDDISLCGIKLHGVEWGTKTPAGMGECIVCEDMWNTFMDMRQYY